MYFTHIHTSIQHVFYAPTHIYSTCILRTYTHLFNMYSTHIHTSIQHVFYAHTHIYSTCILRTYTHIFKYGYMIIRFGYVDANNCRRWFAWSMFHLALNMQLFYWFVLLIVFLLKKVYYYC